MKQLLFGIFLLALCGCHRSDDTPAGLIPEDKMVQVQVDIHIADAVVEHKSGVQVVNIPLTNALYDRIYKNYGITAAQYKASYKYYEGHPDIMDRMYTQIITELSKKEAVLNK
jgi:hypothetical protein